mmetsp:Transcript_59940/g.68148  ORF Transcript_59940/g.68148 Transcript_59940/m.68148 type:complete len:145 (+) Transcript_59940:47-481(+)
MSTITPEVAKALVELSKKSDLTLEQKRELFVRQNIKNLRLNPIEGRINPNIPGLKIQARAPNNNLWYRPAHTILRNGQLTWKSGVFGVKFAFTMFFTLVVWWNLQPMMHGHIYEDEFDNFQRNVVYDKLSCRNAPYHYHVFKLA